MHLILCRLQVRTLGKTVLRRIHVRSYDDGSDPWAVLVTHQGIIRGSPLGTRPGQEL